jgi:phage terminase large subunit-like protein
VEREQAQQVIDWATDNWRIALFEPNCPQERAINLVGDAAGMVSILSTANGVGKTSLVVNLIGNLIWSPQTAWFDKPLFRNWPHPKRVRYVTDPKLVEEIGPFHSEIEKCWPKGQWTATKGRHTYYSQYFANGWIVDVMTYEQARKDFEGGNIGLIICDEPPPRSIWHACITRLRLGGLIMVLMTPLTEAAWFFDEVLPRHQDRIIYATMEDVCKQHSVRGHLDHDQIQRMIEEMDPDEVEARAYGKAMYLKGLIFKTFDSNIHVSKNPLSVPPNAQIWQTVDPHVDKPFACIWGYPTFDGRFIQVAEWPREDFYRMRGSSLGLEEYKKIFLAIEQGWTVKRRIIDRHFADTRTIQTKRTLREDFQKIGITFEPSYAASEEVETGILKVRSWLNYNPKKAIDTLNRPKYLVDPRCVNTIKGFQRWSFDPKSNEPQEAYKDFMDCVRYMAMADPRISQPLPPPVYKKLYG